MKKNIITTTLILLFVNNLFSQDMNRNFTEEELINIRKSISFKDENVGERYESKDNPFRWEYLLNNDPNADEYFSSYDSKELSNGNIGVASAFYYRSGSGYFYSAHPAVILMSSEGEELARNSFFRPGYTTMSYAPYLFEKNGELYALTTYSPEHDPLSFNHFMNYDNPPADAILTLYKLDDKLNLVESCEHSFPIDTFENRGWINWEYFPNEYSGNLYLFSAFEDEGDIIGAYFKQVSADYDNPRGLDSLFFFRMNFEGEIINKKGYEMETHGGWVQSVYCRNQMVKTDSHYILYEKFSNGSNTKHGRAVYYDKEFNYVTSKYMRHLDYNQPPIMLPLEDISVVKANDGMTYLATTASNIQNPSSDDYNDCRLYKFDDDIENTSEMISSDTYFIRGYNTTYDRPPLLRAIDIAPDSLLYFACNYDLEGKPYSRIECINTDLDTIVTLFYGAIIEAINATEDGDLLVCGGSYITKFPASAFGFEPDNIEEAHAHGLKVAVAYPNPGGDVMNIRTGLRNATLQVYDMQGRKVHEQEITDEITSIDASRWESGTYIWKLGIRNEELGMKGVESGKWVK